MAAYADSACLADGEPDPARAEPLVMAGRDYWRLGPAVGRIFEEARRLRR